MKTEETECKPEDIEPGYKLMVYHAASKSHQKAEILGKRTRNHALEFYVHYIGLNRRLDEWVPLSCLSLSSVEIPRKKKKADDKKNIKRVGAKKINDSKVDDNENKTDNTEDTRRFSVSKTSEDDTARLTKVDDEYKIKNVRRIQIRNFQVDAWYFSPYPKGIAESDVVYICEFCLYYYGDRESLVRHAKVCNLRHPPGIEIYRCEGGVGSEFRSNGVTSRVEEKLDNSRVNKRSKTCNEGMGHMEGADDKHDYKIGSEKMSQNTVTDKVNNMTTHITSEFATDKIDNTANNMTNNTTTDKVSNIAKPASGSPEGIGTLSFFELDGYIQKNYCRNLSLLSKLFLDHKSLYYDIDVFMYYVLCRREVSGYQIVGYFSKEKISEQGYNLACILTLPYEQRKGYGRILMDFSYTLSKREHKIAGPEKPLSDLGLLSYRAYWLEVIVEYVLCRSEASIREISRATHIAEDDIIGTLCSAGILKFYKNDFVYALDVSHIQRAVKGRAKKLDEKYLCHDYM